MKGESVLVLANAEWDWPNRINCHHIAARLAKDNHVLFVDTIGGRTPAPREFKKIARRLKRIAGGVRRLDDALTVLSPFVIPIYGSEFVRRLNTEILALQIKRVLPKTSPMVFVYLPALVGLVGRFHEKLVIYHCIDEHAANPNVPADRVREWERQLLSRADGVFASSSTLFEDKRRFNPHTFYLPNVADAAAFSAAQGRELPAPAELRDISHPIAGFVGNISAYKVNLELLAAVAEANPEWTFVLIGPVGRGDPSTDVTRLASLGNVRLLGERPYKDLPSYVAEFDVCLIPFNLNESTRGTLPMKFFEYLAAGKPVVATDLPSLTEFKGYYYAADNPDQFAAALRAAHSEDGSTRAARVDLANRYSWDRRMVEIEGIVAGLMADKGG